MALVQAMRTRNIDKTTTVDGHEQVTTSARFPRGHIKQIDHEKTINWKDNRIPKELIKTCIKTKRASPLFL